MKCSCGHSLTKYDVIGDVINGSSAKSHELKIEILAREVGHVGMLNWLPRTAGLMQRPMGHGGSHIGPLAPETFRWLRENVRSKKMTFVASIQGPPVSPCKGITVRL